MANISKYVCFAVLGIGLSQAPSKAALLVETFNSTNTVQCLSDAEALNGGIDVSSSNSAYFGVINFTNLPDDFGLFNNDVPWPGRAFSGSIISKNEPQNNHFAARITGNVYISVTDTWTFGKTNDDGMQLFSGGQSLIIDDSLHPNRTFLESVYLGEGTHALGLIFFEQTNTAALELSVAQGSLKNFSDDFRLMGDNANGGRSTSELSTQAVPEAGFILSLTAAANAAIIKRWNQEVST